MNTNPPAPDPDDVRALHSALVSKRTTLDQLLWQAPVIALTAQAFLLTIAFDTEKCEFYRRASGIVATVIGLISWQLFLRHDALEKRASKALEQMERQYFKLTVHERPVLAQYSLVSKLTIAKHIVFAVLMIVALVFLARHYPSYRNWSYGLGLLWNVCNGLVVGVAGLVVIVALWSAGV